MPYPLHRFKLAFALSLTLAAIAAAPAAARFAPDGGTQPVPPSTHATLCSEVCSGGGYTSGAPTRGIVTSISRVLNPVTPQSNATHSAVVRAVRHDSGFAWDDAGIGAGAAIVVLTLIVGGMGAATTRRARRLGRTSASVAG